MLPTSNRNPLVLCVDDDTGMQTMVKTVMEAEGYSVVLAADGAEGVSLFEEYQPDIILMDLMMPVMDGLEACARIQALPGGAQTPVVIMTAYDEFDAVEQAFKAGSTDYLTKPINWAVLRNRVRRLLKSRELEDNLQEKIQQLDILHRIDRELGYTLNIERVLNLAIDSALRRSGATVCGVAWLNAETLLLERLASVGKSQILTGPMTLDSLYKSYPYTIKMFQDNTPVVDARPNDRTGNLFIPMMMQGKPAGFIALENVPVSEFTNSSDWEFLVHLAGRTAAALDKTRIYQKTQTYASQLEKLYQVSTTISSRLERQDVIELSARGIVTLLEGSSACFLEYDPRIKVLRVKNGFVQDKMPDALPDEGTLYSEQDYPDLMRTVRDGPRQFRLSDSSINPRIHSIITAMKAQSILVVPLIYEEDLLGMLVLCESRNNRQFQPDEISLVRSMALQATVALQQATLFANVRELEQVKSEMIRMASHDLRNPLHSVKGYLELLLMDLASRLDAQQTEFVTRMKNGLNRMQSLMEDILNLEKIESQQDIKRQPVNMWMVVSDVSESGRSQADLKHQNYIVNLPPQSVLVSGSEIQLTQAFTNLVGNAIKYTPDEGRVEVRSWVENGQFRFEVEDSGFGIPQDRQNGLFQRFYRAQAPGTEDIPGTGLGLSLVKAVIERHGGEVYFSSTPGVGSTFGCWLPLTDTQ